MALTKLTTNLISGDIVTSVNGASGAVTVSTGTDWVTAIQTANFTSVASKGYFVNTTSSSVTITLPVGTVGDELIFQDYAGTFATNKLVLVANGSEKIQGSTEDSRCIINNATVNLVYQSATEGWTAENIELNASVVSYGTPVGQSLTYTTPSPQSSSGLDGATYTTTTFTATKSNNVLSGTASLTGLPTGITIASQTYNNTNTNNILTITLGGVFPSVNYLNTIITLSGLTVTPPPPDVYYLVVAGAGGGGGSFGGGGGAGGYLTNYSGTALSLLPATNYITTVGGGGGGGTGTTNGKGTNGSNSIFASYTATGGGAGASYFPSSGTDSVGNNGGSGGGGATNEQVGSTFAGGTATSGQGNNGGSGLGGQPYCSGGGGGAGASGSNSTSNAGGNGGTGLANSITGSSTFYAGGGGGASYTASNSSTPGSGGSGGGAAGVGGAGQNATDGTINTGGGGGGGGYPNGNGGSGGSGLVILRYSNSYTITIAGGLTGATVTVGTDKVTSLTIGTGNIQFN